MAQTPGDREKRKILMKGSLGGQRLYGFLLAGLTSLSFSLAPPITKGVINLGVDPTYLLFIRYGLSALLIGFTTAVVDPRSLRIAPKGLVLCMAAGLAFFLAVFLFTWSLTRISASIASLIMAVYPLLVLLLLALRGERITLNHGIRFILGLLGVYLLIGPGGRIDMVGFLLVLGCSLSFAVHLLIIQWFLQDYAARTVTFYVVLSMALIMTGVWGGQGVEWHAIEWQAWLGIGFLGVVSTFLGQLALFAAISRIGSGQMALFSPVEIMLTVFWSFLFLGDRFSVIQWVGTGFILLSMLLAVNRLRHFSWRARLRFRM